MKALEWKRIATIWMIYVCVAVVGLPTLFTFCMGGFAKEEEITHEEEVISALEEYVVGVVGGEMPALFEVEALKAQAVAARTYQIYQMQERHSDEILYDVGQVYLSKAELAEKWGDGYDVYYSRIADAVLATHGEIMVYDSEPILAAFHAQSGGMTESSALVWGGELPYLQSVASPWDSETADFTTEVFFTNEEIHDRMKGILEESESLSFFVQSRSEAGYVLGILVGDVLMSGGEVRNLLGLRSSNFYTTQEENGVTFTTYGYGHGCGMSQQGANELAKMGMTYLDILSTYYSEISFANLV